MRKVMLVLFATLLASQAFAWKVCIDPGHGGSDPGAVGYVQEASVNLDTSLKLEDWMDLDTDDTGGGSTWSVYMTRSTDVYVSLSGRTTYANNNSVDRFLSIHSNSFSSSSANGSETYCYTSGSSNSFDLRNKVNSELISHGGLYNRGTKTASFYVVRYTNMPAALTELGFVSNYTDSQSLGSSTWRDEVAKGFLHAFQTHLGYSAYTPSAYVPIEVIVDNTSSSCNYSSNWWASTWSTQKYGASYLLRSPQYTSDACTFSANLGRSSSYNVYAWWVSASNRTSSAPYIVYHTGGSSTVNKDQTANGGQWVLLGTYNMNSGTSTRVALSCWTSTGTYVIADAIKIVEN